MMMEKLFTEPTGLFSVKTTDLTRKFNDVLKGLEDKKAVEIQGNGVRKAILVEPEHYLEMINLVKEQNDYIEELEDLASVETYENTPKKDRGFTDIDLLVDSKEKNEFLDVSNEELFGR